MPPSSFSWLDNNERDRRRALEVIDLLRQQDTRDQLGIGTVRDALSDVLAPGTSTIQTRARYLLFIPWAYQRLEKKRVPSNAAEQADRTAELSLAKRLGEAEDAEGAIGAEAGKGLKRLASAVYWAGLGILGIRLFPGSQDQYHRALDRIYREEALQRTRKTEAVDLAPAHRRWHPHLPKAPTGFPWEIDFHLTQEEALFLQDRIRAQAPDSAFSFLVGWSGEVRNESSWWADSLLEAYPDRVRADVLHAKCFSEAMHGAALLYNLLLAEAYPREDLKEQYADRLAVWRSRMDERAAANAEWDRTAFWHLVFSKNARIPQRSKRFAEEWISLAHDPQFHPAHSVPARDLIRGREIQLKGSRARLVHREYLLMWGGSARIEPLSYRWGTVRNLVGDVLKGLGASGDNARAA